MPRKICVVTGSRADYGLLRWLMQEIQDDDHLVLQMLVTGMHMSSSFGFTYREVESDGFVIHEKVDMTLTDDSPAAIAKSMGVGLLGVSEAIHRLQPDLIVLLGDRFEIFVAAQVAMLSGIPIAHIHGGEITEGAIDEAIRHSITKMSHLHFTAAEEYTKRIVQLGEQPDRVYTVGAPGLDQLDKQPLMSKSDLEKSLKFDFGEQLFLVTYHPLTLAPEKSIEGVNALLQALDEYKDAKIIITGTNADMGHTAIYEAFSRFVSERTANVLMTPSLGHHRYMSAMKQADVVIGNSSSGLIEAPVLGVPTINIGDRQKGRLRASSVLDCAESRESISGCMAKALSGSFCKNGKVDYLPYGKGGASKKIKDKIKEVDLHNIIIKEFNDIDVSY